MHFDLDELAGMREVGQRLRDLPTEIASPLPWSEFKRRELNHRARVQRSFNRPRGALVASLAVIAVSAGVIWSQLSSPQHLSAHRSVMPMSPLQVKPAPVASEAWSSAASERWLAALPAEPVIVRVDTRAAVTNLEDRIAWIDDALTSVRAEAGEADRARALQNERDRLIGCLVQVRYAETLVAALP
jgi:hypothetical protein